MKAEPASADPLFMVDFRKGTGLMIGAALMARAVQQRRMGTRAAASKPLRIVTLYLCR